MTILFMIQRQNVQRVKTDKTGSFDSINTFKFYDHKIVMKNESIKSTAELTYTQFFTLLESNDYFIFYFTENQVSLIRKRDIDDLNAFKEFIANKFRDIYKKL